MASGWGETRRTRGFAMPALVCLLTQSAVASPVFAGGVTDYVVTKTADTNDGACTAGDCSLREAINAANANPGADRVVLGAGLTYVLTIPPGTPAGQANGDLDITDALTIEGNGSKVDAGALDRVINIQGSFTVTINNLTITNGAPAGFLALGGGILVRNARLVLNGSTVSNSNTADNGGGIAVVGSYDPAAGTATLASLTLANSTVTGNTAPSGGGIACILCALMTSASSHVDSNTATADGGGIAAFGDASLLSVVSSSLMANQSSRGGGLSVPFGMSTSALSRNRIVSNAAGLGKAIFTNGGIVTATNNWWGCNYGPGATGVGCTGATNDVSPVVGASPYLVLKATASPQTVPVKATANVAADLTFNSASADTASGGTVPDGLPASFADPSSKGMFATPVATSTNGKAIAAYTAGNATGIATPTVTIDGQTASTSIVIVISTGVDLNGDGSGDVFTYNPATGDWMRLVTQPGGGFASTGGQWDPGWLVAPGRFNADMLTDLFLFNATSGQWFRMINNGTGFTAEANGFWWPGWQRHLMDLNGDGITDVFLYDPATGVWFKSISVSAGFLYQQGGWNPDWEIRPVRLNGDAFDDMFLINRTTGRWFWALGANGGSFTYPVTETWFPSWKLYPGDFDGDGLSDFLLHDPPTGTYFVARNTGTGYAYVQGAWSLGWTPWVVDLNADLRDDLFLHDPSTGVWFEMIGTGSGAFSNAGGQTWSLGWNIHPTDLNGDRRGDILLYHPTTGAWYQARNLSLGTFTYSSGNWVGNLTIVVRAPFY